MVLGIFVVVVVVVVVVLGNFHQDCPGNLGAILKGFRFNGLVHAFSKSVF